MATSFPKISGGIGRAQPSDFHSKPGGMYVGFGSLAQQGQGEKVEAQEALPPAVVLGAESLSLMSQHFPREPAKRCFRAIVVN